MTPLWLIRHGQTDWNLEGRYQGQSDAPLNAAGRAQAETLARQLTGKPFAALYSSDLQRARETAEIIGASVGLSPQGDVRLREINQGEWEGQLVTEIIARYQQAWAERKADPLGARAPGGESVAEVAARASEAADVIAHRHPRGAVLIVSHGLTLATLLCQARGRPLGEAYQAIPENAIPEVIDWPSQRESGATR
jgi:broad specificity phosphatase PhoE